MKVIEKDRVAEQINAEVGGELLQITFNPNLTMIEILSRGSIITHQEATSDAPIVNMSNGNICLIKHLCTSPANHRVPSVFLAGLNLNAVVINPKSE